MPTVRSSMAALYLPRDPLQVSELSDVVVGIELPCWACLIVHALLLHGASTVA